MSQYSEAFSIFHLRIFVKRHHMKRRIQPTGFTVEIICQEIDKYETLTDFIANNPRMFEWLMRNKIKLTDISDKPYKKPKGNPKPVHQFTLPRGRAGWTRRVRPMMPTKPLPCSCNVQDCSPVACSPPCSVLAATRS